MLSSEEAIFLYSRNRLDLSKTWKDRVLFASSLQGSLIDSHPIYSNVNYMNLSDPYFPERLYKNLGPSAPPVLTYEGNINLFQGLAVGFCGSRNASQEGLAVTSEIAKMLAEERVVVVSGNARGVDETAHYSTLEHGGKTIFVLPEGIKKGRIRATHKPLLTTENHLVVSEFYPSDVWLSKRAMQRNRTIIGLSNALVVIEAGETGGTINAGMAALERQIPLFVVGYANPPESAKGNQMLIDRGGIPLLRDLESGTPRVDRIISAIRDSQPS